VAVFQKAPKKFPNFITYFCISHIACFLYAKTGNALKAISFLEKSADLGKII
jgi:hypothetical protein